MSIIVKEAPTAQLSQIGQTFNITFTLGTLSGCELTPTIPWIKCKDYITDVIWSQVTGWDINVYGLNYKYNPNLKLEDLWLVVKTTKSAEFGMLADGISRLDQFYSDFDMATDGMKTCFAVKPAEWCWYHPMYMSLFTLLIRCLCIVNDESDILTLINKVIQSGHGAGEVWQCKRLDSEVIKKMFERRELFRDSREEIMRALKDTDRHYIHGYMGIYSICNFYKYNKEISDPNKLETKYGVSLLSN